MLAAFFLPVLAWGCPRGPVSGTTVLIDPSTNQAQFFNGYVCAIVAPGRVVDLRADFQGRGEYGANVLASAGMTLQSEDAFGRVASSGDLKPEDVQWAVAKNETSNATATMSGVCDRKNAPRATETWTFTLLSSSRTIEFQARGSTPGSKLRAIRRQWDLQSTSIYAMYDGGLVQMKGAGGGSDFYASDDGLGRVYSLGGSGSEEGQVGNMSIDIIRSEKARASQTVLMSSKSGSPYWSGLQEVLAGGISDKSILDHWKGGWAKVPAKNINPGLTWSHNTVIGVNDFDFPVGALAPPSDVNMELSDIHATMMGIYASPVGCLCTHMNEVSEGEAVGQIATSIARPDRGYQGTYNYFDPDNYMSISAMLWSNDPYLQAQARRVLERSGAFLKPSGQLPHHFQGTDPVYQALSGEIQTGPNVFWVLSCFRYAKSSQDLEWLRGYMPRLRNATAFLFSLVDPKESLAKVPGSLMIDVFLRSNYTSDTNAMLVGFLREFAEAEEFVGNSTGAASLRSLSDAIATAMNERLWDAESDDHYVTQWDGPAAGTKRDFIDYDANLIAGAHGIPDKDMAGRMLKRIDGGQCRPSATFVSEKYYGKDDTANGNIGDSWTAMGRIAWFDALTRKRYGDADGFDQHILSPLRAMLLKYTWMHERITCDGKPMVNRTAMYFEYPSVVAMLLRHVKYGVQLGYSNVTVDPFAVPNKTFSYRVGDVNVDYSPTLARISVPGNGTRVYRFFGLQPDTKFKISAQRKLRKPVVSHRRPTWDMSTECSVSVESAQSDADGRLEFTGSVGTGCLIMANAN